MKTLLFKAYATKAAKGLRFHAAAMRKAVKNSRNWKESEKAMSLAEADIFEHVANVLETATEIELA